MTPPKKKPAKKGAGKPKSPKKPKKKDKPKGKKGGPKVKKGVKQDEKAPDAPSKDIGAIETTKTSKVEAEEKPPTKKLVITDDAKVIMVLWSFEILHQLIQSFRTSFTKDALADGQLTQDIQAHRSSSVAMMVFVVSTTMAVGNYATGKPKFSILMIGLIFYMMTMILGIKLLTPHPVSYAVVLILAQIGWHAVTPVRYWLIFHQTFPISVKTSVIMITVNECLETLAQYVGAVWVEHKVFSSRLYLFAWMILSLAMTVWLGALVYVKVSNSMNSTPDDKEAIEKSYASTEVVNSFEARQTSKHWIFFVLLISPSMMFPAVKETVGRVVGEQVNPHPISRYRLDIILAIVFMPVASAALLMLEIQRHEIRGMLLVGLAKFLNIVVLALYLVIVITSPTQFRRDSDSMSLESRLLVDSMPNAPIGAAYIIIGGNVKYYSDGDGQPYKTPQNVSVYIERQIIHRVVMPIKLFDENLTIIASDEIVLFPMRIILYAPSRRGIRLLPGITKWLEAIPENQLYFLFNSYEPCPGGSDGGNEGMIWVNKTCKSLKVETSQLTANRTVLSSTVEIVPRSGDISEANIINSTTTALKTSIFLNGSIIGEILLQPGPDEPWTIIVIKHGVKPEALSEAFHVTREIWRKVNYGEARESRESTTCLDGETTKAPVLDRGAVLSLVSMCLAGVAFGISSISYIHFVWIQCPHNDRMLTLSWFFTVNYVGGWIARHLLSQVNLVVIAGLLAMQAVFWVWHIVALVFFIRILPPMTEEDKNMLVNRRF